jgi:hypothetical protein
VANHRSAIPDGTIDRSLPFVAQENTILGDIFETRGTTPEALRRLLNRVPFDPAAGSRIGIKLHWGERGNQTFLSPQYTREIVRWLKKRGMKPFVVDTTALYSGGRRSAAESLDTAAEHGFSEKALGCPVVIGDGPDGRDIHDIPAGCRHFRTVQAASIIRQADGFVLLSHFKGHIESGFGGAIKNLSMGLASRAQKQRMHADAHPVLKAAKCNRCGLCAEVCPTGAASLPKGGYPRYDLKACIGCAQCIALCPQAALKIFWETDVTAFQERLVETAAAIWGQLPGRCLVINALLKITVECDCMPGNHPVIADDHGFIAGFHPVTVDGASLDKIGAEVFDRAHPGVPWRRQFSYAREIGFLPGRIS